MINPRKFRLAQFIDDVWTGGDIDSASAYVAPRYTIHHDPGDPWDGRVLDLAAYQDRVRRSRAPFPDQAFDIQDLYADGDTVVMTWLWSATHLGDLPGFAATGTPVRMSGATAYAFASDERLTGHWQITDRLGVFQQLQARRLAAA